MSRRFDDRKCHCGTPSPAYRRTILSVVHLGTLPITMVCRNQGCGAGTGRQKVSNRDVFGAGHRDQWPYRAVKASLGKPVFPVVSSRADDIASHLRLDTKDEDSTPRLIVGWKGPQGTMQAKRNPRVISQPPSRSNCPVDGRRYPRLRRSGQ
jgi:hypothetical protein